MFVVIFNLIRLEIRLFLIISKVEVVNLICKN